MAVIFRELILEAVKDLIDALSSITTVQRKLLNFTELGDVAYPQMPLVAVVGKLPKPVPHKSGRTYSGSDRFISALQAELVCYAMDNKTPDTKVSELANDLWSQLYSNPKLITTDYPKGLAFDLEVIPEVQVGTWDPYVVFKMTCTYKYVHGTGGI